MSNTVIELNPAQLIERARGAGAADGAPTPAAATPPHPRPGAGHGLPLDLRGIGKRYGERSVLEQIDLQIRAGEFVAIVGRSGCGKSTLLRLLAQLEQPSSGQILSEGGSTLAGQREQTRIMFQDARLLPWKRVLDNVALGLGHEGRQGRERARQALDQVGLLDRADEWPAVLSGGQRQRVALARALVHAPRLLLLDEPLGALDALTRIEMHRLIERLWQQHGFTAILVTHDVSEAVALADRVLLIEDRQVALDRAIALPRPRSPGSWGFARLEDEILQRVLQRPPLPEQPAPLLQGATLRFAV